MATTFGPNYSLNQQYINTITSGATILAQNINSVLGDLNLSGYSMGAVIGNFASFSAPFDQNGTIVSNILAGYSAAIASTAVATNVDVGALVYKYKNLGGF